MKRGAQHRWFLPNKDICHQRQGSEPGEEGGLSNAEGKTLQYAYTHTCMHTTHMSTQYLCTHLHTHASHIHAHVHRIHLRTSTQLHRLIQTWHTHAHSALVHMYVCTDMHTINTVHMYTYTHYTQNTHAENVQVCTDAYMQTHRHIHSFFSSLLKGCFFWTHRGGEIFFLLPLVSWPELWIKLIKTD